MEDLKITLPNEIQKTNFRGLDGLRAVSILIVIIFHTLSAFQIDIRNIGAIGVFTFFVISGFLITTLLLKERLKYGNISLKGFYIRRGFRILPVAYLYLIVLICLNAIYNLNITKLSFLKSFFFVKNIMIGPVTDWYTAHFWSLGIEEQFYLIFPFLITWLSLRNYKILITCWVIILPVLSFVYTNKLDTNFFHFPRSFHLILSLIWRLFGASAVLIPIGSLFSVLFLTQNKFIQFIYEKATGLSSLLLFIIGCLLIIPAFPWYVYTISEPVFGIIIAFVIILNLKEQSFFSRLLDYDLMKKIGILSYSMYIWQQIFTYYQPWYKADANIFLIIVNLILLFIVSWLSYTWYERKFLMYKDRFKRV